MAAGTRDRSGDATSAAAVALPVLDRVRPAGRDARDAASTSPGHDAIRGAGDGSPWLTPRALPELRLPFDARSRSRFRATLSDGREVAILLPRGTVLRNDAVLEGEGIAARVAAADEDVIEVEASDPATLARAAYHLGNRHVPVEVRPASLVFGYDPVLADMLVRMGLRLARRWSPFEPEAGAYGHSH